MVNIIMCTYNGGKYIEEQLQSIVDNTENDWKIFVFDDQSTDNTLEIIYQFEKIYPDKITVNINNIRKGAIVNFLSSIYDIGLKMKDNDFIMLCDQDDIWNPNKIQKTKNGMNELISVYGNNMPLLVCTDVTVVDDRMNTINDSFRRMNHYSIKRLDFSHLIMENKVQGCTTMINKSMALMLSRMPDRVVMHDGWMAFVASAFGKIKYIDEPTMKYRQHGSNVQGSLGYKEDLKSKFANLGGQRQIVMNTTGQITEFIEIYGQKLPQSILAAAKAFATLRQQNFFVRRYHLIKYHMWKSGILRNIGLLVLI
jgi:glycosyltransferase involved in cell wall biosynthesis